MSDTDMRTRAVALCRTKEDACETAAEQAGRAGDDLLRDWQSARAEMADEIAWGIAALPPRSTRRPMTEAPRDRTRLLPAWHDGFVGFGSWWADAGRWVVADGASLREPTHWQPLPPAPEVATDG